MGIEYLRHKYCLNYIQLIFRRSINPLLPFMKKLVLLIIFLLLSLPEQVLGYEIMVMMSSSNKINQQIQNRFIETINQQIPRLGVKAIQLYQVSELVIGETSEHHCIQKIQRLRPDLILAIGTKALRTALDTRGIPVVQVLVVNPGQLLKNIDKKRRVSGVSLAVPPGRQLDEINKYLPEVKRIGLIYDPHRSGEQVSQLQSIKTETVFTFLPTREAAQVPGLIQSLQGKTDLLWMLPDLTVTNQKTLKSYILFSIENKIPLLTFSEKILKQGATLAVTFDLEKMAVQAAELAVQMLLNNSSGLPHEVPPHVKTVVNYKMAEKLDIAITAPGEEQ